jgi:hypothetical protein
LSVKAAIYRPANGKDKIQKPGKSAVRIETVGAAFGEESGTK